MGAKQLLKRSLISGLTLILGDKEGFVIVPVLSGPNRGQRLRLDLSQMIEPNYLLGSYERNEVNFITSICQKDWIVWDCGIYLGYYTLLFAKLTKQVIAFEPDPRNAERTRANLLRNHISNFEIIPVAVGAPHTETELIVSHNTNSHIKGAFIGSDRTDYETREQIDGTITVRSISLDEAYGEFPTPNLIKVDIEGAESEALKYTEKICREAKPILVVELHNPECDRAAWEFSERANYQITSLDTGKPIMRAQDVTGTIACIPR